MAPVDPPGSDRPGDRRSLERPSLARRPGTGGARGGARRTSPDPRGRLLLAALALLGLLVVGGVAALGLATIGHHDRVPVSTTPVAPSPSGSSSVPLSTGDVTGVEASARQILRTWGHPQHSYRAWWSALRPLLTPGARGDYAGTDPSVVPSLVLSGTPTYAAGPSRDTATVFWATSAGRYGVDLSRSDDTSPWRMVRILFPGQESSF